MTEPTPRSAAETAHDDADRRLLEFARAELGLASERHLRQPAVLASARARLQAGAPVGDAVLAEIHPRIATDRRLADEFAGHFLFDLLKLGTFSMADNSKLRRFLDTGDLVLSVFGDMWGDVSSLQFESANQFRSLFAQRMRWKAADEARRLETGSRREDLRVAESPEDLGLTAHEGEAPVSLAVQGEERERLILILLRMEERDRRMLTLHLKGRSARAIGVELGLDYETARKALQRAVKQARHLAELDSQAGSPSSN
ncbi:MAG: sigma-70 family RNA polymerase sigma factor [Planctomycetota bacterium]